MFHVPAGSFCTQAHMMEWVRSEQGKKNHDKTKQKAHREQLKQVRRNPRAEALLAAQELARISRADDDGFCTCVTCGHVSQWNRYMDGGHFIPKGSSSYWMLDPRNIWPQCKSCNGSGMKFHSAESRYTLFMVNEFGQDFVNHMLDTMNTVTKRKDVDYDEFIAEARKEIALHKKRIGA